MPVFFRWRIQQGLIAFIFTSVACVFCVMQFSRGGVETPLSLTTVLGLSQVMGVTVAGGYGALCGSLFLRPLRQRRGLHRHPLRIGFGVFWPVILVLTGGYIPAYVALLVTGSQPFLPRLDALFPTWLMCVAICGMSLVLGTWLPAVVSPPIAALSGFYLTAFPWSFTNPLLKNMTTLEDCCHIDAEPDPRVLIAVTITALGLLSLASALLTILLAPASITAPLGSPAVLVIGLGCAIVAWTGSALLVRHMEYHQTVPRTGEQTCTAAGAHEYCYWPEEAEEWDKEGELIRATIERLKQTTGIDIKPVLSTSQKRVIDDPNAAAFTFRREDNASSSKPEELTYDEFRKFTYGQSSAIDSTCAETSPDLTRLNDASESTLAWLAMRVGIKDWSTAFALSDPLETAEKVIDEVDSKPESDQLEWFKLTNAAIDQCRPDLLPEPVMPSSNP